MLVNISTHKYPLRLRCGGGKFPLRRKKIFYAREIFFLCVGSKFSMHKKFSSAASPLQLPRNPPQTDMQMLRINFGLAIIFAQKSRLGAKVIKKV
jgi:hypothetical protein